MTVRALVFLFTASLVCVLAAAPQATQAEEASDFVGTDECIGCHEKLEGPFSKNIHSKSIHWNPKSVGCEDCHGPGRAHSESDEGEVKIGTPADLVARKADAVCLSCHEGDRTRLYWRGSSHQMADVSCVSCHSAHAGFQDMLRTASEGETCFTCHPDQRLSQMKRSRHPLNDSTRFDGQGDMTCSSCHNAHGTQSEKLIAANTINDKCYECHRQMQAPVLWEHSPVKESCLNCHAPHGSNYPSLLVVHRTRLCQSCHEAGRHQTVAGQNLSFVALNRGCNNCHAQVHGSNHPSGLKLKR